MDLVFFFFSAVAVSDDFGLHVDLGFCYYDLLWIGRAWIWDFALFVPFNDLGFIYFSPCCFCNSISGLCLDLGFYYFGFVVDVWIV